jgi:pyruvate formate lyase activating enzyme
VIPCKLCKTNPAAQSLNICADCLRRLPQDQESRVHPYSLRKKWALRETSPRSPDAKKCRLCSNECRLGHEEAGYCGLRKNSAGKIKPVFPERAALARMYLDPLPTNCCAAWFCRGSEEKGYNLAFFFYGCNLDCLFCQNSSHKRLKEASFLTEQEVIHSALLPEVRCVCFFGGSPEPQLPFALRVSEKIIEQSKNTKHICWEWNGCGHPALVKKAAQLSQMSGGTIKFDLKAYHPNIARALCGADLSRSYKNFSSLAEIFPQENLLTATTLLVPYYVDKREVEEIAKFISRTGADFPYSLLVFHPDFLMADLPVTPRAQAEECYQEVRRFLSRVYVGNMNLLK